LSLIPAYSWWRVRCSLVRADIYLVAARDNSARICLRPAYTGQKYHLPVFSAGFQRVLGNEPVFEDGPCCSLWAESRVPQQRNDPILFCNRLERLWRDALCTSSAIERCRREHRCAVNSGGQLRVALVCSSIHPNVNQSVDAQSGSTRTYLDVSGWNQCARMPVHLAFVCNIACDLPDVYLIGGRRVILLLCRSEPFLTR
jgi:hypothetical protein